jgi:hypothetical protein
MSRLEAFAQLRHGLVGLFRCLVPGIGSAIGSAFSADACGGGHSRGLWAGQPGRLSTSCGSANGSAILDCYLVEHSLPGVLNGVNSRLEAEPPSAVRRRALIDRGSGLVALCSRQAGLAGVFVVIGSWRLAIPGRSVDGQGRGVSLRESEWPVSVPLPRATAYLPL